MPDLVPTGIPGLDEILGGGLREGSVTLLEGIPGTGKTTIGLGFLYQFLFLANGSDDFRCV